ncbi:hypothetical protein TNIN_169691, partial [Trichonephila inaurata madagascariensis]
NQMPSALSNAPATPLVHDSESTPTNPTKLATPRSPDKGRRDKRYPSAFKIYSDTASCSPLRR